MDFPYMYMLQPMDSIDIDEIGNVCLNALSDDGQEYYLSIVTSLGFTTIQEFGPLVVDMNTIPTYFNYNYREIEYNEKKVQTTIENFINNTKRAITQVFEIDNAKVKERLKNLTISEK